MSSNKETISVLKKKREELEASVKACQDEIPWAQTLLKTTKDREFASRKTYKDDARSAISDREQKLKDDTLMWKRQVEHTSDEQKSSQNELQEQNKSLAEWRLALLEAEEVVKTTKASNDRMINRLESARSILQRLANDDGSDVDTVSTLVDLEVLATSINKRFFNLEYRHDEMEKVLAGRVKHSSEIENKLAITTRQPKHLTISSKDLITQLDTSALEIFKVDIHNEEFQREFWEKKRELEGQVQQLQDELEKRKREFDGRVEQVQLDFHESQVLLSGQVEKLRDEFEKRKEEFDRQVKERRNLIIYKK